MWSEALDIFNPAQTVFNDKLASVSVEPAKTANDKKPEPEQR